METKESRLASLSQSIKWPSNLEVEAAASEIEHHHLEVYLSGGRAVDVRIDGESVYPTWFKLEFKESGEVSAKIKGIRLSSRSGDTFMVHTAESATTPHDSDRMAVSEGVRHGTE